LIRASAAAAEILARRRLPARGSRYSSITSRLVIEMMRASTFRFESVQRKAAWAKVGAPFSKGRMSLRRAPIRVFM